MPASATQSATPLADEIRLLAVAITVPNVSGVRAKPAQVFGQAEQLQRLAVQIARLEVFANEMVANAQEDARQRAMTFPPAPRARA